MYCTQPGEKGAGRTLLTLALNNQDKPNAVDNTDIIIAYDEDEKTSNLQIVSNLYSIFYTYRPHSFLIKTLGLDLTNSSIIKYPVPPTPTYPAPSNILY